MLCLACGLLSCTQTDSSTSKNDDFFDYLDSKPATKIAVNPKRIIEEVHNSCGLFCDSEKLKKYTEKINVDNVVYVVNSFKNTYGKSIFKAIMLNNA